MAKTHHKTHHWGVLAAAVGTLVAVGMLLLILLMVVEARPAEATFPGKPGKKIVYSGQDAPNGDTEIYTIDARTGHRVQLTHSDTNDYYPDYSPNGKKIAYSGYDAPKGDYEIYTINAGGGGGKVQLTDNDARGSNPDYSPNGKKIAYGGYDGNDSEIYTINAGGGGKHPLTDNSTNDYTPSWGNRP